MGREQRASQRASRIAQRPSSLSPRHSVSTSNTTSAAAVATAAVSSPPLTTSNNNNTNGAGSVDDEKSSYRTSSTPTTTTGIVTTHRDLRRLRQKEIDAGIYDSCEEDNYDDDDDTEEVDDDDGGTANNRRNNRRHDDDDDEDELPTPGAVAISSNQNRSTNRTRRVANHSSTTTSSSNSNGARSSGGGARDSNKPSTPYFVSSSSDEFSVDDIMMDGPSGSAPFTSKKDGTGKKSGSMKFDSSTELPKASIVAATAVEAQYEIPIDEEEAIRKEAEAAALSKYATGEVVDKDEMNRRSKRTCMFRMGIAALVVAIIVGVVVGVVIATGSDGNASTSSDSDDPSLSTDLDTPLTFLNISDTAVSCRNAIPIMGSSNNSQLPIIVTGSTANATFDSEDPDGPFQPCNGEEIGDVTSNGKGVWYSLVGEGEPLQLSTCFGCSFDTQISVYKTDSSSDGCSSSMTCVASNDQRTSCGADGSHFTFLAEAGVNYLIFLHGRRRAGGVFTLLVNRVDGNNNCVAATVIEDSNPTGQVAIFGTSKFSTADEQVEECNDVSITSPGSWYVIEAKASRFLQARVDDFQASVTVFTGTSCDNLSCVTANREGRAMWTAQEGTRYFILVHGDGNLQSDFSMSILPGGLLRLPPGTNDRCDIAEELPLPQSLGEIVDTEGSTSVDITNWNFTIPSCGSYVKSHTMGRWFSVVGNGESVLASTCETESGFISQVVVYSGECSSLQCINGGDGNCGDQGAVAWHAAQGVTYKILVIGVGDRVGDFTFTLENIDGKKSSVCDAPIPITLDGISVLGTTQDAVPESVGSCHSLDLNAPSSFYTVNGTGGPMIASTCDSEFDSYAKIEVYRGSTCLATDCLDRTSTSVQSCGNQMSLTWQSQPDETYLIQVYGSFSFDASNMFSLMVEGIPESYRCSGASDQLAIGGRVSGSTRLFSTSGVGACSAPGEEGVWFKIRGEDETMALSACSGSTNFDAKMSLFVGSDCGQLTCLASNNGMSCGPQSFLTWNASSSQDYFVLIQGSDPDNAGNFEISLGIENDICDTAKLVTIGQPLSGTTFGSTTDKGMYLKCFKGAMTVEGPGTWHRVLGNGSLLSASTCSGGSTSTRISIYSGSSCSDLSCLSSMNENERCDDGLTDGRLTWYAEDGQPYYVLVHSFDPTDFVLNVEEVENSSCSSSLSVDLIGEPEVAISQSAISDSIFADPCTGSMNGLDNTWYTVSGTGGVVTIDACDINDGIVGPTTISVYNQNCSDLSCMAHTDFECSLSVETVVGETYSVMVGSAATSDGDNKVVEFDASNDSCQTAFGPLVVGKDVEGSTVGSSVDGVDLCGPVSNRGGGVWYTYIGQGDKITVFTCSEFTDFDTQITVYSGDDCGNLTCIDSRDDNCGRASWLTFDADDEVTYYILVTGKGESAGKFVLSIQ